MAQKPIKKIKIKSKPTKYKKVLENPINDSQKVTKEINKRIIKKFEDEHKVTKESNKKK